VTRIVSVLVTGIWLAALFLGQSWWLAFMLFGYIVLVPVTAILFGDEEDVGQWGNGETGVGEEAETTDRDDALEELRARYARGELTEAQFERKLDRLLETETLEDIEDEKRRSGDREDEKRRSGDREDEKRRSGNREGGGRRERELERE
jgi:uncharacterized membrane protein